MKFSATTAKLLQPGNIVVIREPTVMEVLETEASRESAGWTRVTYHVLHSAHEGNPVYSYAPKHIIDKVVDYDKIRDERDGGFRYQH